MVLKYRASSVLWRVQCLRELQAKGLGAMYYGLVPKLLQTVSHAALMFAFYEKADVQTTTIKHNVPTIAGSHSMLSASFMISITAQTLRRRRAYSTPMRASKLLGD
eukprot:s2837_g4.t1